MRHEEEIRANCIFEHGSSVDADDCALAAPPVGVPSAEIGYTRQNSGYAGVGGQLMRSAFTMGVMGRALLTLPLWLETASCWDIMMSTIILWCSPVQRAST